MNDRQPALDWTTEDHDWLVALRRRFHQYPELMYGEYETAGKIRSVLDDLHVPYVSEVAKTGIVARLEARRPGPTLAFRSDMDALPLEEANEVAYRSKRPGIMHACGHDGHMTIALGVIRRLVNSDWIERGSGTILFIFQPAEEGGAGAAAMLKTGIFDPEPVSAVFCGHLYPQHPLGRIGIARGVSNAASDTFQIELKGRGGHGAHPHLCRDPIVIGAQLLLQLQTLISREQPPLEPAVITVGRFQAGTASNIIPEKATLTGTLRTLNPDTRTRIAERLKTLVEATGTAHRIQSQITVTQGYPVLLNDLALVDYCLQLATELLGEGQAIIDPPRMGAEDFAYFAQRWPGVLIGLGCHDPQQGFRHGLHSPHFDMDERVLDLGVSLFVKLLGEYPQRFSKATSRGQ